MQKERQLKGKGVRVWSEGVLLGSGWGIEAASKKPSLCWDLDTQNKYPCFMIACDVATSTSALCLEQWGHLWSG